MRLGHTSSIEDLMTGVREHRSAVPHFDKAPVDQLLKMIWVNGEQCPFRFDVSKRPNEVDGPQGVDP